MTLELAKTEVQNAKQRRKQAYRQMQASSANPSIAQILRKYDEEEIAAQRKYVELQILEHNRQEWHYFWRSVLRGSFWFVIGFIFGHRRRHW
jgi:hypothetical protein